MSRCSLLVALPLLALGCLAPAGQPSSTGGSTQADLAQYAQLSAQLNQHRTQFLAGGAGSLAAVNDDLFWLTWPGASPVLNSLNDLTQVSQAYGFSIGDVDSYNYSASPQIIATIDITGDTPVLHAYGTPEQDQPIGSLALPQPPDGQQYQAYTVDEASTVYYVDESGDPVLMKWIPGAATASAVLTFSALGIDASNLMAFTVSGTQLLLADEAGALWSVDLAAQTAQALGNLDQVSGTVSFNAQGVLYQDGEGGVWFYDSAAKQTTDVAAAIAASPYQLNATFASAQLFSSDAFLFNGTVYYISKANAVFAFTLATGAVAPVLLPPNDGPTIVYTAPTVLDDGSLFTVGLTSTEGDTGFDGPVYEVKVSGGGS